MSTKEDETEEVMKLASSMAKLINKNISAVTAVITENIEPEKIETVLSAFAGVYTVAQYYEYKLSKLNIPPQAVETAKEAAEKYILDIIATDLNSFKIEKGEA